jgi:hypothetical protein
MSTINDADLAELLEKPYEERTMEEVQQLLQAPTPPALIEWRGQDVRDLGNKNYNALALAYVDARFMQNRLDEVLGMFRWQSQVKFEGNLLILGIGIVSPDSGEWIWKYDTGQEGGELRDATGFGGSKGVYSTSFKRACYQWGLARDLYSMPKPRMRCKAYSKQAGKKTIHVFTGWIDHPTGVEAESTETGRTHKSQVDDSTDHMPANSNTFYGIAYNKLQFDREAALNILEGHIDKGSGEINYVAAIMALEKNMPAEDRKFTIQEETASKKS